MARIAITCRTTFFRRLAAVALLLPAIVVVTPASALTFPLPPSDVGVVGQVRQVTAAADETLLDIGRRHGLGYLEMKIANPGTDMWVPGAGTQVVVPTRFILPDAPREGVVVNVAEMRLYYYPEHKSGESAVVETYPISVGRQDWTTPLGATKIIDKIKNPSWYVPDSILKEAAAEGVDMPAVVPPGPDNPLGEYKIRLGLPGYLIHGTNRPWGVGMRVTHGCIRMYPEDIDNLFARLPVGTPVHLVNQPVKIGRVAGSLYVEAHPVLEGDGAIANPLQGVVGEIAGALDAQANEQVDYAALLRILEGRNGIPAPVLRQPESVPAQGSTVSADRAPGLGRETLAGR